MTVTGTSKACILTEINLSGRIHVLNWPLLSFKEVYPSVCMQNCGYVLQCIRKIWHFRVFLFHLGKKAKENETEKEEEGAADKEEAKEEDETPHPLNNNNNNNNRIQRRYLRFSTISSQRRKLSPTRTLKWPGCNRVQITCNTLSAYHVQVPCYVPLGTKGQLSY